MGCNCKMVEGVLAAIILLVALFALAMPWAKWTLIIVSLISLGHASMCKAGKNKK